jgi:hypothetical protein
MLGVALGMVMRPDRPTFWGRESEAPISEKPVKITAALLAAYSLMHPSKTSDRADQSAAKGSRAPVRADGKGHRLHNDDVLTLQDISPVTVFCSDRPNGIVGRQ